MKYLFVLLFILTAGANADTVPPDALFDLETTADDNGSRSDAIGRAVSFYRDLGEIGLDTAEPFDALLQRTFKTYETVMHNPKNKAGDYFVRGIDTGVKTLMSWAEAPSIKGRAKILRLIYATAKLEEITAIIEEQNKHDYFGMYRASELWQNLVVKLPCETFEKYPNDAVDGLLSSVFRYDGSFRSYDTLPQILGTVFACPSGEFYALSGRQSLSVSDVAQMYDYLNGRDLDAWFAKQVHVPKHEKTAPDETPSFPVYDYKSAMKRLEGSSDPNKILMLALLRHTFETPNDINGTAKMLDGIKDQLKSTYIVNDFKPKTPYDGTDASMVQYLRHYSENQLGGAAYFVIPCAVLIKKPGLLPAIAPYYGSNRDNFLPRDDCSAKDFPLPPSVEHYLSIVNEPQNGWLQNHTGSIRYAFYKDLDQKDLTIRVFPKTLLNETIKEKKHEYPYETWSYLNLENRKVYAQIRRAYITAKKELTKHYVQHFNLTDAQAEKASKIALWLTVAEAHWGEPPRAGLRYEIMAGQPYDTIAKEVNAVNDLADLTPSNLSMEYYGGAWGNVGIPDPLIMVAVDRPKVLKLLIDKNNSTPAEDTFGDKWYNRLSYDNPSTAVNARNAIGKTALLAAVQQNQLDSTKLLIAAGADTGAVVDGPLIYNKRTVAMYAAADGDREMIRYLKRQGVDFNVTDSRGIKPYGYLMGFGMLESNPHLNRQNYRQYLDLLGADLFPGKTGLLTPSYACSKASTSVEKTICRDPGLAILDRILSTRYRAAYNHVNAKASLKTAQTAWLKERDRCTDKACIEKAYHDRLKQLRYLR